MFFWGEIQFNTHSLCVKIEGVVIGYFMHIAAWWGAKGFLPSIFVIIWVVGS